jgi:hypothetical protein
VDEEVEKREGRVMVCGISSGRLSFYRVERG